MTVLSKLCCQLGFRLLTYNCYEVGHTWAPSCVDANLLILKACFLYSLKIYTVLHLVTTLVKRPKLSELNFKKLCLDIVRSSVFLSSNGFLFLSLLCLLRLRTFGFFIYPNAGLVNGIIASYISICLERPHRRGMLALYLLNLATETLFRMAVNRGIIRTIPKGEIFIFALALAGYFTLFRSGSLNSNTVSALRFIFGAGRDAPWLSLDSFPPSLSLWLDRVRRFGGNSNLCTHPYSCLSVFLEGFLRNFLPSFGVTIGLQLVSQLPLLFRNPVCVLKNLLSTKSLKLPLFLGCLPAFYSGSLCLLHRQLNVDNPQVHALSGFLSGLAMLFYPSTSVSLYVIWKLIEIVYMKAALNGYLPRYKDADKYLYAFSTGFVLFVAILEPHALRPAYWTFLKNLTGDYDLKRIYIKMLQEPRDYFEKCYRLLAEYKWIYDFKVTNFFVEHVWQNVPMEWMNYLTKLSNAEIYAMPSGNFAADVSDGVRGCPASLKKFINDCFDASLLEDKRCDTLPDVLELSEQDKKCLTEKKRHEIACFAPVVVDFCRNTNCRSIVDVGCGLGYLAKILAERTGCTVFGVDSDLDLCQKASTHRTARNPTKELIFHNLRISNIGKCTENFLSLIKQMLPPVLILCLHGCGDLQPALIQQFAQLPKDGRVIGLFAIGCCYHKMTFEDEKCLGFPLSCCAKEVFSKNLCLSSFGLRLAAQETKARWSEQTVREHEIHANNVGFRAALAVLESQGHKFRKLKRRLIRIGHCSDFESFLESILERTDYDLSKREMYRSHLVEIYKKYEAYFVLIEPFTALQVLLQGPLESVLLLDRFMFLKEQGFEVKLLPVFDSAISPRNMLMTAFVPYIDDNSGRFIHRLREAVEIKSVSAWPENRDQVRLMVDWTRTHLEAVGAKTDEIVEPGMQTLPDGRQIPIAPILLAHFGEDPKKKTICVYGHLDVQPAAVEDGWNTEPFQLIEKDGKLFGRGSTDDKGTMLQIT